MITNSSKWHDPPMAPGGPPVVVLWILPRCVVKFQPATTQRIWEKNSPMVDCVQSMGQAQNSSKFHRPFGVVWGSTHLPRKMIKPGFLWCFFNKKWGSPAMGCTSTPFGAPGLGSGVDPLLAADLPRSRCLSVFLASPMTSISIDIPLEIYYWKWYLWIFSSLVFIDNIGIYANFWISPPELEFSWSSTPLVLDGFRACSMRAEGPHSGWVPSSVGFIGDTLVTCCFTLQSLLFFGHESLNHHQSSSTHSFLHDITGFSMVFPRKTRLLLHLAPAPQGEHPRHPSSCEPVPHKWVALGLVYEAISPASAHRFGRPSDSMRKSTTVWRGEVDHGWSCWNVSFLGQFSNGTSGTSLDEHGI